jgi:serine/threonine protein kinase
MHHTSGFTTKSSLHGSVRWMAPELLMLEAEEGGNGEATLESDVYSLAMLWWEVIAFYPNVSMPIDLSLAQILTANIPFYEHRHDLQVLMRILAGQRPLRPPDHDADGFSRMIWPLVEQCWDQSPASRPTMFSVMESLGHFIELERWSSTAERGTSDLPDANDFDVVCIVGLPWDGQDHSAIVSSKLRL